MKPGLTRVKVGGQEGTVIMVHGDGNVNIMLDSGEYRLNVAPHNLAELGDVTVTAPKPSFWNKLAFWRKNESV